MKTGIIDNLIERYSVLAPCRKDVEDACDMLCECFASSGKLLVAGNGGSAADAEHIVGEMMKTFVTPKTLSPGYLKALLDCDPELGPVLAKELQGSLPAIALDGHFALSTAYMNDCEPRLAFAQQVSGYGREGDVFLGITTSGNSANILYAAVAARARGMKVIGLTGERPCRLDSLSDICIKVPGTETYKVQELHLPVYHCICLEVEKRIFG